MIGRAAELAVFAARLAQAEQSHGQVVGIVGGPGIGKSRFVAEAMRLAQDAGFAYGGECEAYGVNTSYLVWQPIWRQLLRPAAG
ncbi:MAG: AAA family ATPase [Caldilineaceae bacterium]